MNDDPLPDIAHALLKTVESAIATDDLLLMLCIYFSQAAPEHAQPFRESLRRMLDTESFDKTPAFVALAQRMEKALSGQSDVHFLSLTKQAPDPTTPEELRARLRIIQGGRS